MIGVGEPLSADRRSIVMSWFLNPFGVRSCRALLRTTKHQRQIIRLSVVPSTIFCVVMYFLLHAFQNDLGEAIYTASDVASIKFVSEWAFALLSILLLYLGCGFLWAYAVSNDVSGRSTESFASWMRSSTEERDSRLRSDSATSSRTNC